MRKYGLHSVEVNGLVVNEDDDTLIVPAVITREGIFDYDGMLVYEPAEEVEKAAFTAENAWIVEDHPPEIILSSPKLIRGTVCNAKFDKDRIKADLVFFKHRCSPKYVADIKSGKVKSVSIGFFWECMSESGEWKGKHYDYVKRDILIDHVAVGDWTGRCSYPACGIGVDTLRSADPYPNEHACRLREPDTLNVVGSGEREHNGKTYRVIYGKPKGEKDAGSVEQGYRYPEKTWTEDEARKHCQDHNGTFEAAKQEGDQIAQDENTVALLRDESLDGTARRKEGYETADALIARVQALVAQLSMA